MDHGRPTPAGRSGDGSETGPEAGAVGSSDEPDGSDVATGAVKAALGRLALLSEDDLVEDDLVARRLLALAVLGRIWPSPAQADSPLARCLFQEGVSTDDLVSAIQPVTLGGVDTKARQLLGLLADAQTFPGLPEWDDLLTQAMQQGLISPAVATLSCSPCSWTVRPTTEAGGPAIAFQTHKRISGMQLDEFDELFVPSDWTNFTPPWCAMTPGAPSDGHDVYLEVLSFECPATSPLSLRTPLQFMVGALPDATGKVLQYRLARDWSNAGGDGLVSVDEGSIVIREWEGALHLITTKRIQFRALKTMSPLEAAWIAQFVWALGYSALAEYFVNRVALRKPIQVVDGAGSVQVPRRHRRARPASEQLGEVVKQELVECVGGIESSLGKVKSGSYDTEEYLNDLGKLVSHIAHYGVSLVKIASGLVEKERGVGPGSPTSSSGRFVSEPIVLRQSSVLVAPQPGPLPLECSALVPGLMQSGSSVEKIAAPAVALEPVTLGRSADPFRLVIEESSLQVQPGGTYTGTVKTPTTPGLPDIESDVWIVIP